MFLRADRSEFWQQTTRFALWAKSGERKMKAPKPGIGFGIRMPEEVCQKARLVPPDYSKASHLYGWGFGKLMLLMRPNGNT
jgi:hypothetical protein